MIRRPRAGPSSAARSGVAPDSVLSSSNCGVSVRNWYPRTKARSASSKSTSRSGVSASRCSWHLSQGLLAGIGDGGLLGPLERPLDADEIEHQELVVQFGEVGGGMGLFPEHGAVEAAEHVDVHLAAAQRVEVLLHLPFAAAGLGPRHFAHLELGEGGLLGHGRSPRGPAPGRRRRGRWPRGRRRVLRQGPRQGSSSRTL